MSYVNRLVIKHKDLENNNEGLTRGILPVWPEWKRGDSLYIYLRVRCQKCREYCSLKVTKTVIQAGQLNN